MNPRIMCATPVYGSPHTATVHLAYMDQMIAVSNRGAQFMAHRAFMNCDLVRARSRAVRVALDECFTHLLFWDSDVVGDAVQALAGMVREDVDMIGAAYSRKRLPPKPAHHPPYLAMGFTLIKTSALEKMWDAYYDELWFDDVDGKKSIRTVALFQLLPFDMPHGRRVLLSEDYSFCERWLKLGGKCHVYDGPGAPMGHIGEHRFEGTREELNVSES